MRALLAALAVSAAYPGAWAAWRPSRELIVPVCTAFALFSALHLVWHCLHLDGFDTVDAVLQTASLAAVLAASVGAVVLALRGRMNGAG